MRLDHSQQPIILRRTRVSDDTGVILAAAPGPDDPVGFLKACHRRIETTLEMLARAVAVYAQRDEAQYGRAEETIAHVIRHFQGPVRTHHLDEELSLLPRLERHDEAVADVEHDHALLATRWNALLPRLLALPGSADSTDAPTGRLADDVEAFAADYFAHIRMEEAVVFPLALQQLSLQELQAIGTEMVARRRTM